MVTEIPLYRYRENYPLGKLPAKLHPESCPLGKFPQLELQPLKIVSRID